MNCSQVRSTMYPVPEKAVASIQMAEAMAHFRNCEECRAYFASQEEWSNTLREKLGHEPAPAPLQDRVRALIEKHGRSHFPQRVSLARKLAGAAVVVVIVGFGIWFGHRVPSQRFFEEVCNDHAKYRDAKSQLQSSDPAVIESWFRDKAEFGVHVPNLDSANLLGGRLCFLKRHKAALIFYRKNDRPVSLFQLSASGVSLAALDRSVIDSSPVWHKSLKGYSVVAFESRGVVTVLVSDLRESELLALALEARRA